MIKKFKCDLLSAETSLQTNETVPRGKYAWVKNADGTVDFSRVYFPGYSGQNFIYFPSDYTNLTLADSEFADGPRITVTSSNKRTISFSADISYIIPYDHIPTFYKIFGKNYKKALAKRAQNIFQEQCKRHSDSIFTPNELAKTSRSLLEDLKVNFRSYLISIVDLKIYGVMIE